MTQPTPWDRINQTDEKDALSDITRMMTGSKMLQEQPGVVYALAAQKARPQDAQAIDQFMQSLNAEKMVNLARASISAGGGGYINLTSDQQSLLDATNTPYHDVLTSSQGAAQTASQKINDLTNGQYTAKTNRDGSLALDASGKIQPVKISEPGGSGGFFHSIGSFFGTIGSGIKTGTVDTLHGLGRGFNFVQGALGGDFAGKIPGSVPNITHADDTLAQDMTDSGYDPNSIMSQFAFTASGKRHADLSELNDLYGPQQVDLAIKGPRAVNDSIIHDPNSFIQDADGNTVLTHDAASKLRYINSKPYETLVRRVNSHIDTWGNDIARGVGIDPVQHATSFSLFSAGVDLASSFAIDPTLTLLKVAKFAKTASVGLDTMGDAEGAASILTRSSKLPWVNSVQRGWKRAIDLSGQMRDAKAVGDTAKVASLTAQFNAELPALSPLMGEFIGDYALTGDMREVTRIAADGKAEKGLEPVFGQTNGIRNLDDAAAWVAEKHGLNLLYNGRAITQSGLMPGALSAFGYRKLKGLTASWMTGRAAVRSDKAATEVLSRASADPALAQKLLDEKILYRMPPEADDAINTLTDQVLSDKRFLDESERLAAEGYELPEGVQSQAKGNLANSEAKLASAQRAAEGSKGPLALTYAGKGQVAKNLRTTGDVLKQSSALGWASPIAIANRARLAAARFSTLLPRNTLIDINDASSGDKIYKMAMTYLGRGGANSLRAAWNFGDAGQKKAIIHGLIDQLGHAAGLGKTMRGKEILDTAKTALENYSESGNGVELAGDQLALFEGQTNQRWLLPSFQALQQASAKTGLWESLMSRPMTSAQADWAMSQWKIGALLKPSTVTRNMLEGYLRTALDGKLGEAIKARVLLTTRNRELFDRGYFADDLENFKKIRGESESIRQTLQDGGLTRERRQALFDSLREHERLLDGLKSKPIVRHQVASEEGDTDLVKQIENSSMLSGQMLGRSALSERLANLPIMAATGRAYRSLAGRFMDDEDIQALLTLGADDLAESAEGYGQQILASDLGFRHATNEATEIAQNGLGPSRFRFSVLQSRSRAKGRTAEKGATSWTHQALDGTVGATRYANAMARRVNAMPETARAAIAHLSAVKDGQSANLDDVVKALEDESKHTSFGRVYFPDPVDNPTKARQAVTDDEVKLGKADWASKVVGEFDHLLTGQNGQYNKKLADYISERGEAPSGDWIADNILGDERPEHALAPQVMAMTAGGKDSIPLALQDIEGGAYQWLVERPLQRLTSMPVFTANYTIARKGLNKQVEQLVEQGFSREAADNFAKELSIKNAWVKTEQLIDDPGQKTQFDVIARNFFPFARATQAMIRRWATGLWQNPAAARKMMLSYEGAVHSGMIYQNAYGEPTFTYPGSGAMNLGLRGIAQLPGFESVAAFPVSSSMTGGVLMSVPGADNPLRMSMGPMISIPLREVYKHLLPTAWRGDAVSLDSFINGPVGTGETFQQLVPTVVRRFFAAASADERNSAMASSMSGAIANLMAAGLVPTPAESNSAEVMQRFRTRLQTQVRSQLFLRAVFGLFAPAAPSTPGEETSASTADYAWQLDGLKQLGDEYKSIVNETGGDMARANAVFTALHPDEVVYKTDGAVQSNKMPASAYETTRSGSTAPGSFLPSTTAALNWLATNEGFVKKYNNVAAYFLPESTGNEPFNDAAYQAQLELGLRLRKTPEEFMNDVYVKHAEQLFYPADHEFQQRIAEAKAAGNTALEGQLTQQRTQWIAQFKNLNPMFGNKLDDYASARETARGQLADLEQMLKHGDVPDGLSSKLNQLVTTYNNYEQFIGQNPGATANIKALHSQALDAFNAWAKSTLAGTPLADLYNGVFHVLNTNLEKVAGVS